MRDSKLHFVFVNLSTRVLSTGFLSNKLVISTAKFSKIIYRTITSRKTD